MTDFGQLIHNVSKSAVLTASGWDTPPADLDNAIDGDLDNPTGTGVTTLGAPGWCGYINVEMPADGRYLVVCKVDGWSDSGYKSLTIQSKHNSYYVYNAVLFTMDSTAEGTFQDTLVAFISSKLITG